ncbi:MAG: hypothetical protein AAGJ46_11640 [Planctomycetota bacterium]
MKTTSSLTFMAVLLAWSSPTLAVFVTVDHQNADECDLLAVPSLVDELGLPTVFPSDEIIDASDGFTNEVACPDSFTPFGVPNTLVEITNLTPTPFDNLWYVADPESRSSNVDGFVNDEEAFKIDAVGLNQPLVFESGAADGVFSPGETWRLIVDNYSNSFGLPASLLASPGKVGGLSGGDDVSAASVIGTRIPEPAPLLTVLSALAPGATRRR